MNIGTAIFLIMNSKNMALLEAKTKFKVCQKCMLLNVKIFCNNIKLIRGISSLKKLARYLLPLKIYYESWKNSKFTKISDHFPSIHIQFFYWASIFKIRWMTDNLISNICKVYISFIESIDIVILYICKELCLILFYLFHFILNNDSGKILQIPLK